MSRTSSVRTAIVARVSEDVCEVFGDGGLLSARYAPQFPTPHVERVSPGHLVALAAAPDGDEVVVWRWYDALAISVGADDSVVIWEPGHGELTAAIRDPASTLTPGARVYASAGLPGAEWWVTGPVEPEPNVDLDEVVDLYDVHGLWDSALA